MRTRTIVLTGAALVATIAAGVALLSQSLSGLDLIVNQQTGQWGTEYSRARDLGKVAMKSDSVAPPVETFTIAIEASDARRGTLVMAWGTFRWTAPIEVLP